MVGGGGRWGGVLKARILDAKYEAKLEFLVGEVGGRDKQKPFYGGLWIVLELHIVCNEYSIKSTKKVFIN